MYYEVLKTLIEDEFKISGFNEDLTYQALDMLNELSNNQDKLSNSKEIVTVSAITFLVFSKTDDFRNFREISEIFGTDAKKVALKAKEISLILNIENFEELMTKGLSVLSFAKKPSESVFNNKKEQAKNTNISTKKSIETIENTIKSIISPKNISKELNDDELINLLKNFMKFSHHLFKNKEYIEIKLFIKIFESNLNLAGYETKKVSIEERFGNLFYQLGFEPKKGREPEKFVKLKDRFGQSEPYSLIKLGD